jgi:Na+-translocating ferredoxin:NAD+ oxidoreductase RNF subunit RnfB
VLILGAIGLVCALVLVLASKFMAVPVDEKFPAIRACLPGANCGACGYAGCDGYANALAAGEEEKTNKCIAGGQDVARAVAETMGLAFEAVVEVNAFIHCRGDCLNTAKRTQFQGARSCAAAKLLFGSDGACHYGCIGYGDCVSACPYGALTLNKNHVAVVDPAVCIGCGLCTTICPRHLISLQVKSDVDEVSFVLCHNTLMGKRAKDTCANTCIGCRRCVRVCPNNCITVENNVARIDISKCVGCKACMHVCPEGAIYPLAWIPRDER